ncbi:AbgT family transporter [Acinetobacter baumannii]|uniref:YfcC family protein n=1 Tax=Acinetobacter baumannii TaxID=470 RepID=UPI002DB9671C|nr:AbgT family transporter [Acinetobacter baumannii]MEB6636318.1 AbgT family transporter [Acinetobacter baumannii]
MYKAPNGKSFQLPHVFIIFFFLIFITASLTYLIPAGKFLRVEGKLSGTQVIQNGTFHYIDGTGVGILDMFRAIPLGFVESASIIFMTLVIGGTFAVIRQSGVIEVAISQLALRLKNKGLLVIPVLMLVFATIDTFIGTPELCLVYIPIVMPLILALKFDSLTAVAVVLLGSCAGFTASLTNPFLVGISQKIAGVPLYSGFDFRVICFIFTTLMMILFVMNYAHKVRKNPRLSPVYELDQKREKLYDINDKPLVLTNPQKVVSFLIIALFAVMIFGIINKGWDMPEMSAIFIIISFITCLVMRMKANDTCEVFLNGCNEVLLGSLIIGLARAVPVLMHQGEILDTVVYHLSEMLKFLPTSLTAIGVIVITTIFNFFISSGSGKAAVLMPILAPLAQLLDISPNIMILAYQYGDGMTMFFWPTSGFFMAALIVSRVPWSVWAKFSWPIFLMVGVLGAILILVAKPYGY